MLSFRGSRRSERKKTLRHQSRKSENKTNSPFYPRTRLNTNGRSGKEERSGEGGTWRRLLVRKGGEKDQESSAEKNEKKQAAEQKKKWKSLTTENSRAQKTTLIKSTRGKPAICLRKGGGKSNSSKGVNKGSSLAQGNLIRKKKTQRKKNDKMVAGPEAYRNRSTTVFPDNLGGEKKGKDDGPSQRRSRPQHFVLVGKKGKK